MAKSFQKFTAGYCSAFALNHVKAPRIQMQNLNNSVDWNVLVNRVIDRSFVRSFIHSIPFHSCHFIHFISFHSFIHLFILSFIHSFKEVCWWHGYHRAVINLQWHMTYDIWHWYYQCTEHHIPNWMFTTLCSIMCILQWFCYFQKTGSPSHIFSILKNLLKNVTFPISNCISVLNQQFPIWRNVNFESAFFALYIV